MDGEFGDDADFAAALDNARDKARPLVSSRPLDAVPARPAANAAPKVQQPKPQALPGRAGPSAILVSTRQKGNPILNSMRAFPWEYSDIVADYVLGASTCALFLSLKYHRLHPEYIYTRIRGLAGKYNLRVLLTMVDIPNHEESLKELSKTSLINNVTVILCWSAQEAGRYLELYKSFENAAPTSIRAPQSTSYSDKLVEFITVPRSINKTDAVGLVSSFGSVRTAVNAQPEEVALVAGWGEKKVQRWCSTVREGFRVARTSKKGATSANKAIPTTDVGISARLDITPGTSQTVTQSKAKESFVDAAPEWQGLGEDEELAMLEASGDTLPLHSNSTKPNHELSEGIAAALDKLRRQT